MLDGDPPNVDGARETARRIIRDDNRASDMITRLRALFSKKEFRLGPLDLNEATREVIALSLSDLQRNRVIVRSELADGLPPVTGDRVQLQQVILNLVRNASDAMSTVQDRPRKLLISTQRDEGDRVRLTVKDVGVVFAPEAGANSLKLSIQRKTMERESGCLSAAPLSRPIMVASGQRRMMAPGPRFRCRFLAATSVFPWPVPLAPGGGTSRLPGQAVRNPRVLKRSRSQSAMTANTNGQWTFTV
jgi:light-regulated signal transduction histidine kinase (bacteriophytochrome)